MDKNVKDKKTKINKKQLILTVTLIGSFLILLIVVFALINKSNKSTTTNISAVEANFTVNAGVSTPAPIHNKETSINESETNPPISPSESTDISDDNDIENTVSDNTVQDETVQDKTVQDTLNQEDSAQQNTPPSVQYSAEETYMLSLSSGTVLNSSEIDFENIDKYFISYEIPDSVIKYITGKSYRDNDNISLSDLRYIKLLHYNFNNEIQVGELIVNKKIAGEMVSIFKELFDNKYQIESMYLIDRYWTGEGESTDSASIDVNNTSSFLYRAATNSTKLSKHAYGMAIDINPQQNPYVSYKSGSPKWYHENANDYIARDTGLAHVITHDDICYKIFKKYGYTWGGDWNNIKDYQHFEK